MAGILTDIDVVNAAFAAIGEDPIESLDDDTFGSQAPALLYEQTVGFNIGLYPFSFTREIRQLSQVTGATPLSGYSYLYDLPADRLGPPIYVTDDVTNPDRRYVCYVLTGGQVHASDSPLYAMIKFRPDPHHWSPTFLSATIAALAAEFAQSIAEDDKASDLWHRRAYGTPSENYRGGRMGVAIHTDAQATPPRKPNWNNNPLERAWRSGASTGISAYPGEE